MSGNNGLFDLSLFAESPTLDHHYSVPQISRQEHYEFYGPSRSRSHTLPRDYTDKPLPPLPQRRLCRPIARVSGSRVCDAESRCILKRIQRLGSSDHHSGQTDTLLQRRNPLTPPALTLSVPQPHPWNRNAASAMVWMPDEQMWLVTGEDHRLEANRNAYQAAYPSPPSYSPRAYTRSEPSPTIPPSFDLTPPLTPIQTQLQSLIQPPRDRDEERLSPLFQEAMNSVPMLDPQDLFLPALTLDTSIGPEQTYPVAQHLRPRSALERPTPDVSPQSTSRLSGPVRSASAGSRMSHTWSDTSDSCSYYSAMSVDLTEPDNSASRWAGLAKRVARPGSAMS